jgi:Uma2 family endonuclease
VENVNPVRYTGKRTAECAERTKMATVISPPPQVREQRVVLNHVSWETYERLLVDNIDARSPRFTYNQGILEIMSPSGKHEDFSGVMADIAALVAEERGVEFKDLRSVTLRRLDLERGVEADSSFYLQNVERIIGKGEIEIDLSADPPPDLVIEVEITSPAVSKLPIYASFGVPEIWLTEGQEVRILFLVAGEYKRREQSQVSPPLTESVLSDFLQQSKSLKPLAWRKMVRNWAREPVTQG